MASIYDGASASGMVDTVSGSYAPNQDKSFLNSVVDAGKALLRVPGEAYDQANNLTNRYFVNPVLALAVGAGANYVANSLAERDYAADHGGQYPPSKEAFSAYKSLIGNGGALSNAQQLPTNQQPQNYSVQNGLNTEQPKGSVSGVLGLGNDNPSADKAQAAQNQARTEAAQAKQAQANAIAKGYTPTPDAKQDPVGFMSAANMNKAKGVGDASGTMNVNGPTPPTPTQQQAMQLNQVGKQTAYDMSKAGPWYKSQSFNYGLISFGLNLLSGNDLATSFGAAGQAFGDMYGQEQRGAWAQDLINQGYSHAEVEQYVRSGDSKVLTDPMEKQAKQVQLQSNLQNLNNLQYENSPEMRAYSLNREARKDALQEAQIRNQMANSNAQVSIARQGLAIRQQNADTKANAATAGDPNPIYYTDTDGRKFTVLKNARGTPLINSAGMAALSDPDSGVITWRNISENQRQMGGIQANEGLRSLDQMESGGLLSYTGNSLLAKGKRKALDELGNNITSDLNSQLDNLNGAIRASLETQLMQENNNRPVQKFMLDTAVKRFGKLDINSSTEENARIISNYRSLLNSQYHARDETHPTVENRNYSNPVSRPGVSFDGVNADSSQGGNLYMGQVVNGMTYIGGNPNDRNSWK